MAKAAKRPVKRAQAGAKRAQPAAAPRKIAYGSEPGFPISLAMRAGDFVFTSAQADHGFDPTEVVYDEKGLVVSDGNKLPPRSMADETRAALRNLEASLAEAGCTFDDVVDSSVWLRDPRDFHEMNKAYAEFFKRDCPTRSIFRIDFMFDCRIEIKVTACKPLGRAMRGRGKAAAAKKTAETARRRR
ncbi:MAG TPA: RidA family protein [Dongiaceae bacterium]|jgi:enamine deaminase RidA (YjgF/YER057c/UK114 family)|nr:RidA family protein [Dongiaceae bacterium]